MTCVLLAEFGVCNVCGLVLRPSHIAVCESLLTSRRTLLFVSGRGRHDTSVQRDSETERQCGTRSRPWAIATARRGQRINVTVVDLTQPTHATDDDDDDAAVASVSDSDGRCRRYAQFTEPEVVSLSRDRCDDDKRHKLPPFGEAPLYGSQTGRVHMVLDSHMSASDKFLLIFTGTWIT